MELYGIIEAKDLTADKVIRIDNITYICRLCPDKIDRSSHTAIEQQNCWNIQRVLKEDLNGGEATTIMYPDGMASSYNYNLSDIENYHYEYRK